MRRRGRNGLRPRNGPSATCTAIERRRAFGARAHYSPVISRAILRGFVLPPCFHLADEVFPQVRAEAARRLAAQGWSQVRIAQAVHLSQGMVSKHVAAKGTSKDPLVHRLVDELLAELEAGTRSRRSPWCDTLSLGEGRPGAEAALADLLQAETRLRQAAPLRLMPQIGLNIARALADSRTPEDILSYPGRLVDVGGALVPPAPPAFGASGHLARCLLALRQREPSLFALANVHGGKRAAAAAAKAGFALIRIKPDPKGGSEAAFGRTVRAAAKLNPFLLDDRTPGVEPCLYVAGRDAREVAARILALDANAG